MTRRRLRSAQRGFTLLEAIVVMVVTGIVAGMITMFMVMPIRGYMDAKRRAEMTDTADLALRRMGYELRRALPNSVRLVTDGIEFIPTRDGGRYRREGAGNVLDGTATGNVTFDVLGPPVVADDEDYLVIYNTGQAGLDAYETTPANRRQLSAAAGATVSYAGTGAIFPVYHSPSQRFQLVPKEGPARFLCTGNTLRRETNYATAAGFATGTGTQSAVLARNVACRFDYQPENARSGLVTLELRVSRGTGAETETVRLLHQIHVDNLP